MEQLKKYAVIIDEAHSSQSGRICGKLKRSFSWCWSLRSKQKKQAEEEGSSDYEEEIIRSMTKRGHQPNISFFCFYSNTKIQNIRSFWCIK